MSFALRDAASGEIMAEETPIQGRPLEPDAEMTRRVVSELVEGLYVLQVNGPVQSSFAMRFDQPAARRQALRQTSR